jgi:formyl-CoA transferase
VTGDGTAEFGEDLEFSPVSNMLRGVRVIDFTQALSGPYCTLMLADLGADVIKVEDPESGDQSRSWGPPFKGSDSTYFLSVNRNKRGVAFDLRTEEGLENAYELIRGADVVVQNWRPGTSARIGLDYSSLRAINSRLIYCSITGFGPDNDERPGYDQIVQGTAGAMTITGPPGSPTKWGIPVADIAAGMFAATAIVSGLYSRTKSGSGCRIDIGMEDSLIAMMTHHAARWLATGTAPVSPANDHPSIVPYGMFKAADSEVNICVGSDAQFQRMCEVLGMAEFASDPRFRTNPERVANRSELVDAIAERVCALPADVVVERLTAMKVPAGRVRHLDEVLTDPEVRARGMITKLTRSDFGEFEVPNGPWRVNGVTSGVRLSPPLLGEHTETVLAELGKIPSEEASNIKPER